MTRKKPMTRKRERDSGMVAELCQAIHDGLRRDPVYRESQLAIGWPEQKCKEWDELANEDHTYKLTLEQKRRYQGQWYLTLNKAGKHGPMKLRLDYRAAVLMKNSLTPRIRRTN